MICPMEVGKPLMYRDQKVQQVNVLLTAILNHYIRAEYVYPNLSWLTTAVLQENVMYNCNSVAIL